jgi:septum formation protein
MLLHDKLKPYRLILASQSPRRQQLLAESGLPYEPAPRYDCQEVYPATLAATQVPRYLSQLKSRVIPIQHFEFIALFVAKQVEGWLKGAAG